MRVDGRIHKHVCELRNQDKWDATANLVNEAGNSQESKVCDQGQIMNKVYFITQWQRNIGTLSLNSLSQKIEVSRPLYPECINDFKCSENCEKPWSKENLGMKILQTVAKRSESQ